MPVGAASVPGLRDAHPEFMCTNAPKHSEWDGNVKKDRKKSSLHLASPASILDFRFWILDCLIRLHVVPLFALGFPSSIPNPPTPNPKSINIPRLSYHHDHARPSDRRWRSPSGRCSCWRSCGRRIRELCLRSSGDCNAAQGVPKWGLAKGRCVSPRARMWLPLVMPVVSSLVGAPPSSGRSSAPHWVKLRALQ